MASPFPSSQEQLGSGLGSIVVPVRTKAGITMVSDVVSLPLPGTDSEVLCAHMHIERRAHTGP